MAGPGRGRRIAVAVLALCLGAAAPAAAGDWPATADGSACPARAIHPAWARASALPQPGRDFAIGAWAGAQGGLLQVADDATPEAPGAVTADCRGCHEGEAVLPPDHVATDGMGMDGCRACHDGTQASDLSGLIHLDHAHYLAGVSCAACHGEADPPKEPDTAVCESCHGSLETLARLTADVAPVNPHDSPHGAPYAECSLCHLQHRRSEDFCATCHDFGFDPP